MSAKSGSDTRRSLKVAILGSTGSVGTNALDVIARHPDRYSVCGLSALQNSKSLIEQCLKYRPNTVVCVDGRSAEQVERALHDSARSTKVLTGSAGLKHICAATDADIVIAAIGGFAGAEPVLDAVDAGKTILLANKECVVAAGHLLAEPVRAGHAHIIPVDSEHNAIYQCIRDSKWRVGEALTKAIKRLTLTASGGPFLNWSAEDLARVTPEQARAHPNWEMGAKISIDSATMANKALELIECCYLFDRPHTDIEILIHPQSIVHAMVTYVDGTSIAHLCRPDMRVSIAYALTQAQNLVLGVDGGSDRLSSGVAAIDWNQYNALNFFPAQPEAFPLIAAARRALEDGPASLICFNAINEELVFAFLSNRIPFTHINKALPLYVEACERIEVGTWSKVCRQDKLARAYCRDRLARLKPQTP